MLHPDYPIWSFVGMVMILLPTPWHWRARNIATLGLIFWLFLDNFLVFINTIVWADNIRNDVPIWCDISGRPLQVIPYAVSMCAFLQMRRLESVASTRRPVVSATERTRRIWVESALSFGFPFIMMAVLYTVQGHRFDITESIGCSIPTTFTWLGISLRFFLPMVICLGALIYAILAIRWFVIRRMQFRTILAASNSGLTINQYLRLIALAVSFMVILVTNCLLTIIFTFEYTNISGYNWSAVHFDFSQVSYFAESLQQPSYFAVYVFEVYIGVMYALLFFVFFGLNEEAIGEYVKIWERLCHLVARAGLIRPASNEEMNSGVLSLGTKVVPASGIATQTEITSGEEKLFDVEIGRDAPPTSHAGIPVLVERSVV